MKISKTLVILAACSALAACNTEMMDCATNPTASCETLLKASPSPTGIDRGGEPSGIDQGGAPTGIDQGGAPTGIDRGGEPAGIDRGGKPL